MRPLPTVAWLTAGALGAVLVFLLFRAAFPWAPAEWEVTQREARWLALERLRDLGDPPPRPYVVTRLGSDALLERRLQLEGAAPGDSPAVDELARRVFYWEVLVYPRGAAQSAWAYRAAIALNGQPLALRRRAGDSDPAEPGDPRQVRRAADRFLRELGLDLGRYEEPEVRTQQLRTRTDTALRYRQRELALGPRFPYGVEVRFAGGRLTGFQRWMEDPQERELRSGLRPLQLVGQARNVAVLLLVPVVAVPFLRRYHAGEIGVRRGLQIAAAVLVAGLLVMAITAPAFSEGSRVGVLSRVQSSWYHLLWTVAFLFLPMALVSLLAWSVGEALCRERWSDKLAAFDALFHRRGWRTETLARSALEGTAAGALLAGLFQLAGAALAGTGAAPMASLDLASWWFSSHWPALVMLGFFGAWTLYGELVGRLLLVPLATARLGRLGGAAVAAGAAGLLFWGPGVPSASPLALLAFGVTGAAALVALFLRYDLLTSLTAGLFATLLLRAAPLALAADPWLELQGGLVLGVAALPMLLSLRSLGGGREFSYRYDDVPPHVRRIAQRERQRLELETARRIQSSILPDLPPRLAGVEIAHAYRPATEVGGDFYDVIELRDGRLAVAVGDVAGHGVSSGLVMAMAKAALAVQVGFDPEVGPVFATLNRLIHAGAHRRLLTTLCYALVDPRRRQLSFASAGHLFPYHVAGGGAVRPLESVSYPLGVRATLEVRERTDRLEPGDLLFLFSDGVVEACSPESDEPFGFERLEDSLARHAAGGAAALRDGVLADLARFAGAGGQRDDLTVLVLRIP
ncbi:MAG: PP2C family protein-serine/threonine phosphatase [Thermoanaerobaculia bacterium]|nr:PP2C family protein-serine/threonine phosphatase [Thermoanaerobaculia bacterium]